VGPAVVVPRGRAIVLLPARGEPLTFPAADPGGAVPDGLVAALERLSPTGPWVVGGEGLAAALRRATGAKVVPARAEEWHGALRRLPPPDPEVEREDVLARAHEAIEAALRSPSEILVTLAREEERLERAVGREARAAEAFVALAGTPLAEYAARWEQSRTGLAAHHRDLVSRLEAEARRTLPNLSAVVGPRTAARLAAAAGGTAPLGRIPAARLQLLGARRRPGPDRGPRFGVLALAEGSDGIPPERRGAYARSLAALAAIAARADVLTHATIAPELVRRREARRARLRRRAS
jgi:hypothetical protein